MRTANFYRAQLHLTKATLLWLGFLLLIPVIGAGWHYQCTLRMEELVHEGVARGQFANSPDAFVNDLQIDAAFKAAKLKTRRTARVSIVLLAGLEILGVLGLIYTRRKKVIFSELAQYKNTRSFSRGRFASIAALPESFSWRAAGR